MSDLQKLQHGFIDYLVGSETDIARHIQPNSALSAKERLNIYAYAYKARLKEAITTDYEILHSYLGDEQFEQLLQHYISKHPSQETNLRYYSTKMASFLRTEVPFNNLPILSEIAQIEAAFTNSFDAKDGEPTTLKQLSSLPPAAWENLKFIFHPAVQILTLEFNSFETWKALTDEKQPPTSKQFNSPNAWLLWRDIELITHYRPLPASEHAALKLALQEESFPTICESLLEYFSEDEVPIKAISYLQVWVHEGFITTLNIS